MHAQVFDSGLIGEGVLHLLAVAKARLLAPGAALVPAAATVYCQPIQVRKLPGRAWRRLCSASALCPASHA